MNSFLTFRLYKDSKAILEDLNDSKYSGITPVEELLKIYENTKLKAEEQHNVKKNPLIILEGLDGSGKSAMSRRLASKISAEKCSTPPESIKHLRTFFDNHSELRTAFYSLGNYIAALEISCILTEKPVVVDRFWHSTTAYALAQEVANDPNKLSLPQVEDDIYKWPSDLLKPDIVILLNVSEEVRLERHSRRHPESVTLQEKLLKDDTKFREDVLKAYTNMREPSVVLVDGSGSFGKTLFGLLSKVKPLLQ